MNVQWYVEDAASRNRAHLAADRETFSGIGGAAWAACSKALIKRIPAPEKRLRCGACEKIEARRDPPAARLVFPREKISPPDPFALPVDTRAGAVVEIERGDDGKPVRLWMGARR